VPGDLPGRIKLMIMKTLTLAILFILHSPLCTLHLANATEYVFPTSKPPGRQFYGLDKMYNGTLVMVYGERSGNTAKMFECTSTDDGATWNHPRSFATVQYGTLGLQRRPRVLIDRTGVMHAVFEDLRGSQSIHVYHCKSTDNGMTWSMPMPVANTITSPHEDFCSMAVDSTNRLVVTFLSMGVDATDELVHVYMVTSSDKGATWTPAQRVDRFASGGSCECCQQNVCISPSGQIAVGFRSNVGNKRDVHVSLSNDNGATFEPPILIQSQSWNIDACPTTGPSMMFDESGSLNISWWDARDTKMKAISYYARLEKGATATPMNVDLSGTLANEAEYPCVTASSDGNDVAITFLSSTGVYLSRSTNGGVSFETTKLDPTYINNSAAFVVWTRAGYSLSMWQGQRDGMFDVVQFREGPTSAESDGSDGSDRSDRSGRSGSNGSNGSNGVFASVDESGALRIVSAEPIAFVDVFDVLGAAIAHASPSAQETSLTIDVRSVSARGALFIQVQTVGGSHRYRCMALAPFR